MAADPVPNVRVVCVVPRVYVFSRQCLRSQVRFNAAKALKQLQPLLDPAVVQQQLKPCLQQLVKDADKDVRYFAGQGL